MRTFNLLNYLSQRHAVTVLTQQTDDVTAEEIEVLRQSVTAIVFPRPPIAPSGLPAKVKRLANFLSTGTPPSVRSLYSTPTQVWLDDAITRGKFDGLTCEHSANEVYVRPQWRSHLRTVVNIHSSVYGTCKNQLETGTSEHWWRDRFNLPLLKRYERRYCSKFSEIVVTTEDDRTQLAQFHPQARFQVIPNGVDLTRFPYRVGDPGGHRLVFIGAMDNTANVDAACFFSQQVFPLLQQQYPDVTLELVGARPVAAVRQLGERAGITVTGQVLSMVEYLHRATVCVIPMRTGFGIKNKTLEAMAAGVPVVGSDRGLEGLAVDGSRPLRALRANEPGEYINTIGRLFEDAALRQQLSVAGRSLVEHSYTWEQAGAAYERVLTGAPIIGRT